MNSFRPEIFVPIFYLVVIFLALGVSLARNGKPWTGHYNFWRSVTREGIEIALFAWAGFFSLHKNLWPQVAYLFITIVPIGLTLAKHGKSMDDGDRRSFGIEFVIYAVIVSVVWWGGLFDPLLRGGR